MFDYCGLVIYYLIMASIGLGHELFFPRIIFGNIKQ